MNKPCGCGDPLTGANIYMNSVSRIAVFAKQMDREFTVNTVKGLVKGQPGDYLVKDEDSRRYIVSKEIFEGTYEIISS